MSLDSLKEYLENGKSFEIKYSENGFELEPYKGVAKTDAKDVKKLIRKSKVKLTKSLKDLLLQISSVLISNRVEFKLIFEREPLLKFDLDRYIKFEENMVKIFGFKSEDEKPLSFILDLVKGKYETRFYKPVA